MFSVSLLVMVRTEGAARHGFADGEPLDGPCVVVGVAAEATGTAYRSAPAEIDAAKTLGIVRGDLASARVWIVASTDRVVTTAVLVGWLVAGPALVLLSFY